MAEATALPAPYQVRFRAGQNAGLAGTVKHGAGGSARRAFGLMSSSRRPWPHA